MDSNRRNLGLKTLSRALSWGLGAAGVFAVSRSAWASANPKSRTAGYAVQKTEEEWKDLLSPMQYFVLREGGTERPYYSVLESEKRPGAFQCAGCRTPLFDSKDKFSSGTGWPSFARGLPGVEAESVDPISARLLGAELRCHTCGGHLGDRFQDGFMFVGTEAEKTGERYCIDGAALIFVPEASSVDVSPVRGDEPSTVMRRKKR